MSMKKLIKTYSELNKLETIEERYEYLKLNSKVCEETFGGSRYLNQSFYRSAEWQEVRRAVILRDGGNELGLEDHPIRGKIYIHHINPITKQTLLRNPEIALDPENLICVSKEMHDAIHYGYDIPYDSTPVIRTENDTIPWR